MYKMEVQALLLIDLLKLVERSSVGTVHFSRSS